LDKSLWCRRPACQENAGGTPAPQLASDQVISERALNRFAFVAAAVSMLPAAEKSGSYFSPAPSYGSQLTARKTTGTGHHSAVPSAFGFIGRKELS
jgi:hypothetical protein